MNRTTTTIDTGTARAHHGTYGRSSLRAGVALVALGLLASACGSSKMGAASPSYTVPSGASASRDGRGGEAPSAPATAADQGPSASAAPAPEDRAGLGTEWGENRDAPITLVSFDRATPSEPFALATVRYNDRDGFRSLVAGGHAERARDLSVGGGAVTVTVRDAEGAPLEAVRKNGQLFVVGRAGERYSLVLQNNTRRRFEAVATVDGLDVMDGSGGSFEHRGYILQPSAEIVIEGFRRSDSEVAAFRFGSVASSYAAQTGSARDVGVIGVALFREVGDSGSESDAALRRTASPFPGETRFAHPPPGN